MGDDPSRRGAGDPGETDPARLTTPPWLAPGSWVPDTVDEPVDDEPAPEVEQEPDTSVKPSRITVHRRNEDEPPVAEGSAGATAPWVTQPPAPPESRRPPAKTFQDPVVPEPSREPATRRMPQSPDGESAPPVHSPQVSAPGPERATDRAESRGPETTPAGPAPRRARLFGVRRPVLLALGGVALLAGSIVAGYALAGGRFGAAETPTGCTSLSEADHVVGDGSGSLDTPMGAVLAFDHGYYVERSADAAFKAVAPSSTLSKEALWDQGIAALPEGTRHCVDARRTSDVTVDVTLRQIAPDGAETVMHQTVTVEKLAVGKYGIVAITPAG